MKRSLTILLVSALLIATVIRSDLFIYSFFTPLFLSLTAACLLIIFLATSSLSKREEGTKDSNQAPLFTVFLWSLYILFSHYFVFDAGIRLFYLIVNFGLLYAVSIIFSKKYITPAVFFLIVSVIASVESLVCVGQYFDQLKSYSEYFAVTGTFENPNVTALFLAMALPAFIFQFLSQNGWKKIIVLTFLLTAVSALIMLECRTAWIGAVAAIGMFFLSESALVWSKFTRSVKISAIVVGAFIIGLSASSLYNMKRASADGRLFIWDVSIDMALEKPVTGFGYGTFEKNYNLFKAAHLKKLDSINKYPSEFVYTAYNEFLENFVEGGVIGLIFFVGFICSFLLTRFRKKGAYTTGIVDVTEHERRLAFNVSYAAFVAFVIMSMVNFTIQAVPVFVCTLFYAAIIISNGSSSIKLPVVFSNSSLSVNSLKIANWAVLGFSTIAFCLVINQAAGQHYVRLATSMTQQGRVDESLDILRSQTQRLSRYESYWCTYAAILFTKNEFATAIEKLENAKLLSSNPWIYLKTGACYEALGDFENAKKEYMISASIEPKRIKQKFMLMNLCMRMKDTGSAIQFANEIVSTKPIFTTQEWVLYEMKAQQLKTMFKK